MRSEKEVIGTVVRRFTFILTPLVICIYVSNSFQDQVENQICSFMKKSDQSEKNVLLTSSIPEQLNSF